MAISVGRVFGPQYVTNVATAIFAPATGVAVKYLLRVIVVNTDATATRQIKAWVGGTTDDKLVVPKGSGSGAAVTSVAPTTFLVAMDGSETLYVQASVTNKLVVHAIGVTQS